MKANSFVVACAVFIFSLSLNATAQVENVLTVTIDNPADQIEVLNAWFDSDDSEAGQQVTLLATVTNGANPATHTIVANFPDYDSLEKLNGRRAGSAAWKQQVRASNGNLTVHSEALMLHVTDNGKSWNEGDFLAVIPVNVSGRGSRATYAAAFKDMIASDMGKEAPGMVRLVMSRAGNETSHVALITAPGFAALNEYMDSFPEKEGYRTFAGKVDGISDTVGGEILRVVKIWD
jgi:hypothetical protein